MQQTCKICGHSYHINMGIFGLSNTHTTKCPQCGNTVYTLTGEEPELPSPPNAVLPSVEIQSFGNPSSPNIDPHSMEKKKDQSVNLLGRLIKIFAWIWGGLSLMTVLVPVSLLVLLFRSPEGFWENHSAAALVGSFFLPLLPASFSLIFFIMDEWKKR